MEIIKELIKWLNANNGSVTALLTFATVVLTWFTVFANWQAVKEMKLTRLDQSSPNVVIYLDYDPKYSAINLVVENAGSGTAFDIKLESYPSIEKIPDEKFPLCNSSLFTKGLSTLAPRYKTKVFFVGYVQAGAIDEIYRIKVKYRDVNNNLHTGEFYLNIKDFEGQLTIIENKEVKLLKAMTKEIEKISQELKELRETLNK